MKRAIETAPMGGPAVLANVSLQNAHEVTAAARGTTAQAVQLDAMAFYPDADLR